MTFANPSSVSSHSSLALDAHEVTGDIRSLDSIDHDHSGGFQSSEENRQVIRRRRYHETATIVDDIIIQNYQSRHRE